MDEYKEEIKKAYDEEAKDYEKRHSWYESTLEYEYGLFIKNLSGKKILDVGSGPGRDALRFKKEGLAPVCIDLSEKMIKLCRQKGIEAYVMDAEKLSFIPKSFDGVWAYTSLLHIPKNKFSAVLSGIANILQDDGIFYISMKKGDFDGYVESKKKFLGAKRYFALYSAEELKECLSENFTIIDFFEKYVDEEHTYFNVLCRKNNIIKV